MTPSILYGTAWKEDETARLVGAALAAGFRGVDTANQRKHYNEVAVGDALRNAPVPREQLFLQTKFTHIEGQDSRLPYDARATFTDQVRQSFASSLEHLGVTYLDSYLLHGPRTRRGISPADREVWEAMEVLRDEKKTLAIGVSNVTAEQLETLCGLARIQPAYVQNRCYARTGWDRAVRDICKRRGITYQAFSLLTANGAELESPVIRKIAVSRRKTTAQLIFRFAQQLGMLPLTGTTDSQHMHDDLVVAGFELTPEELQSIETISG